MEKQFKVTSDDEDQDPDLKSVEFNETLEGDIKDSSVFQRIVTQIERDLSCISSVKDEISKMRESAASIEFDLVSTVGSSTWENISELIGVSSNMIDCIKFPKDDDQSDHEKVLK